MRLNVVSVSTGKDSTATALLARETCDVDTLRYVTADTGNEHESFEPYLDYLEEVLDAPITRLRADFTEAWWSRRDYVRDVYPTKLVKKKDGFSASEAEAIIRRILAVLDLGPTGNPYLDLCIIKGRFPSRKAQFCTQELKTKPLVEFQMGLIAGDVDAVWSWQGVRGGESDARRHLLGCGGCAKYFEVIGGGLFIYRPIVRWEAPDCFETMAMFNVEPNPLYREGMSRVGCMPCINASKLEIRQIAARFPAHMDRIEAWEATVKVSAKRGDASFFPDPFRDAHLDKRGIRKVIQWSRTTRGGKHYDLLVDEGVSGCSSSYGLCEGVS